MQVKDSVVWICCRAVLIVLLAGLTGAVLVRATPGFGVDERSMDPRFSARTQELLREERVGEPDTLRFYLGFLKGLLRGDAGSSAVSGEPVTKLIRERAPTTFRNVAAGLVMGWIVAFLTASAAAQSRRAAMTLAFVGFGGLLLSVPSAVLATVCLLLDVPPSAAIAAVAYPRLFPHIYEQFRASLAKPHVLAARSRGVPALRVFVFHVIPVMMLPLLALAGISITLAFGASVPIEALADSPGLGQLAWNAALGRDLPVLVGITLLLTFITVAANAAADIALIRLGGSAR